MSKDPPDEFAVVTKAPLVVPPDFNLKPPKPGKSPTNQNSPTATAESTLYGDQQTPTAKQGRFSAGEAALLNKAGAANGASDMIRQQVAADNRAMQSADESFTNRLLFGFGSSDNSPGKALDADAEAKRLGEGKAGTASAKPAGQSTPIQKDSGGWLDGIF